jgi:hypothetical protein
VCLLEAGDGSQQGFGGEAMTGPVPVRVLDERQPLDGALRSKRRQQIDDVDLMAAGARDSSRCGSSRS